MSPLHITQKNKGSASSKIIIGSIVIIFLAALVVYVVPLLFPFKYVSEATEGHVAGAVIAQTPAKKIVRHIRTPNPLKAIYMSSWTAGSKELRDPLIELIDKTELNAVVIDIKDYTGRLSYHTDNAVINEIGSPQNRISDIKEFIQELHDKNIYVIGRVSTFQDAYLVVKKPELAVKRKTDGKVWKDRNGISWIDASAKPAWDYFVEIGKDAFAQGFDEINFDYIRFPSDGDMKNIAYPYTGTKEKAAALKEFFEYVNVHLKGSISTSTPMGTASSTEPLDIPVTSADLFGMTTSNRDDLGIGQVLENALPYFDYVAPMVYPSHYPATFLGFKTPAEHPYEVIDYAMSKGVERAKAASTSPAKLRPWLQDFSIGHTDYTPEMVRAQMEATYKVGLDSWMLWNAASHYTASALKN